MLLGTRIVGAAFTSQPTTVNVAPTSLNVRFTIDTTENVRCVLLIDGATAPTATEVNAGTGSGGSTAAAAPPAVSATADSPRDVSVASLTDGTAYDLYCATATGLILSDKIDIFTSGFPTMPSATSIEDDRLTVSMVSGLTENVRCIALLTGATAPTASNVNAGTGASGDVAQANPLAAQATTGATYNLLMTGLQADTVYDVYCATEAGALSNVLTFGTSGFATEPNINTAGYDVGQITVSLVLHNSENVRCAAVAANSAAPSASAINSGTGVVAASSVLSGTGGATSNLVISGLSDATAYDIYCATVHDVRSNILQGAFTTGFSTQPR